MTWPDGIAAALGLTTALLITHHQHQQRSTTQTQHTRRTENQHDRQDTDREEDHHRTGRRTGTREEGHRGPAGP